MGSEMCIRDSLGNKEGHGSGRSQRPSRNFARQESEVHSEVFHRVTEGLGDERWRDGLHASEGEDAAQWDVGCGLMLAEVADTADDGKDGAEVGITAAALPNHFVFHAILLRSKRERSRGGLE